KNRPRLFAKLVIAVKTDGNYTIIAPARYIDNVDAAASSTFEYPKAVSKKGLQIQMVADAQELGVSNTVINVPVNEYLHAEKQADSLAYVFYNQTYYFDNDMVQYLDHRVKVLTEANVSIYLNIVLTAPDADMPLKLRSLYYDNVSEMAEFFAFNMQNQDSVMYLEAFLTFLAERYTRDDAQYGFAGSFIMGYEVNSNRNSNSMGSQNMDSYLNSYIAAFRVADTALRSVYSNGRVYLSLANNFSREATSEQISTDPQVDYAAKSFLDAFNEKVKYAGNIPWRLAINPYPSDPANTTFWNDEAALDSSDTPYITMKNIDVLCDYLKQETFLYNGQQRSILISEFGVSADPDSAGVTSQAAAVAYSYYKAVANSDIEAIIYHRHVDHDIEAQAGLWYGIWTHSAGTEVSPSSKKTSYNVFKYMDTTDNISNTAFALTLLGVDTWEKLIPGFKDTMAQSRTLIETVAYTDEIERGYRDRLLCEFSEGDLFNFYPSDNTSVVELRADTAVSGESMMYAAALCDNPREYMGVSSIYTTPLGIKNSDYFTIKLKAEAPNGVENISVMLRLFSDNGTTYEGIGQVKEGVWSNVTFDISELSDKIQSIDGLKLWIKPYGGTTSTVGNYALWLDNITIQEKGGFTIGSFLITLLVLILLGGAAIGVYLYMRKRSENGTSSQAMRQRAAAYANQAPQAQQRGQAIAPGQYNIPPQQGTAQFNKLGTLSSDEEFRAAYGDSTQGRQQVRNMQASQNPQAQQMQNPQYRQPMNGQMQNNQRRPMPGQNQYRQPMNGQPMQGQMPNGQMQGQPMNGQPQMNNYRAQHRQYQQQGNMTMPMQNQQMQNPYGQLQGRQMQGQPGQMPYQQGQVQFRTNAQGQVRRQVNRQPMQNRYAQSM
nr:hypothetical protein [Clostridia bacterium]